MLTQAEITELNKLADELVRQIQYAIKNKPIERIGRRDGQTYAFKSVANATGRLHDSVQSELYEDGIRVTALAYVEQLIYGRRPGTYPPVTAIEKWMETKGLNVENYLYPIVGSINKYGTTIWQRYQGSESNLLEDVNIDALLTEFENKYAGILEANGTLIPDLRKIWDSYK